MKYQSLIRVCKLMHRPPLLCTRNTYILQLYNSLSIYKTSLLNNSSENNTQINQPDKISKTSLLNNSSKNNIQINQPDKISKTFLLNNNSKNNIQINQPDQISKKKLLSNSSEDIEINKSDILSGFVDNLSITFKHKKKEKQINKLKKYVISNDLSTSNSNTTHDKFPICQLQILVSNSQMDSALKYCQEESLKNCSLDFLSIVRLCSFASRQGHIESVKKLQKLAYASNCKLYESTLSFQHYLAEAEFICGHHSKALQRISELILSSHFHIHCNAPPKINSYKKLKDATVFLVFRVPSIDDPALWKQADELVKSLIEEHLITKPACMLWRSYLISPLHADFKRADALFSNESCVRAYVRDNMTQLLKYMVPQCDAHVVRHLLQQLLLYRMHKCLPPITSILISMYCDENDVQAALATLQFAVHMKFVLSSRALLRLQHLLHTRGIPLPDKLLRLKYDKPSLKIPPYQF